MTTVAVTQLKNSFKEYADKVENGEVIIVKRPKGNQNIVMINESEYAMYQRAMLYYSMLKDHKECQEKDKMPEIVLHGMDSEQRNKQLKVLLKSNFIHKTLEERFAEYEDSPAPLTNSRKNSPSSSCVDL